MYEIKDKSLLEKNFIIINHILALGITIWLLILNGLHTVSNLFGKGWEAGNYYRRIVLVIASAIYLIRIIITCYIFIKRKISWGEAITISIFVYIINIYFSII